MVPDSEDEEEEDELDELDERRELTARAQPSKTLGDPWEDLKTRLLPNTLRRSVERLSDYPVVPPSESHPIGRHECWFFHRFH